MKRFCILLFLLTLFVSTPLLAQPGFPWIVGSGTQAQAPSTCYPFRDLFITTDTLAIGTCRASNTWVFTPQTYAAAPTDGFVFVEPANCSIALTTGAFAANPANSGAQSAPAMVRAASGNTVLQVTTTAAANTSDVVCDLTPASRLTAGKGIVITAVDYLFGYQTTALTSIGTAVVNSITYPAAGGTPAGTVAAIGGSYTVTPGTSHSTPGAVTTSGQCYHEKLVFGTPYPVTTDNTRIALQNTFAQSAAAATVLQICGAFVYYSNPNSI